MRIGLRDFISALPHSSGPGLPKLDHRAITTGLLPNPGYVWPDVEAPEAPAPSPLALISAAGAMGKSEAAKNVAAELSAAYVDLAELRVGSNSLSGELFKALGVDEGARYMNALKSGTASLVLDSTDEAQLAAGRDHFIAFLQDLAWLLMDAAPRHQVLLLGRPDSMLLTHLALADLGFDGPTLELAPLNHDQAAELIDLTLDRRIRDEVPFTTHRTHPVPFGELRELVFGDISNALGAPSASNWSAVEDFLGYPPVLLALAERLAVDNPAAEVAKYQSPAASRRMERGELLQTIVEGILDREAEKVGARMGTQLAMRDDDPERSLLYTRNEQALRLLRHTGTKGVDIQLPERLSANDKAKYEENVGGFVLDHPFVTGTTFANAVFSDYIRAWAVSSPLSPFFARSRANFLATLPNVGPFFAEFLFALSTTQPKSIPEALLGDAIRSHSLGSSSASSVFVHHDATARLALLDDMPRASQEIRMINFEVTELSGVVDLFTPLSRLTFVTDHAVILHAAASELEIGPEVGIIAETIEFDGNSLTAVGGISDDTRWSFLSAQTVTHSGDLKVASYPADALSISWPDPWDQWKPFAQLVEYEEGADLPRLVRSQILLGLRRILMSFRASMGEHPSVSADKVNRVVVGANDVFTGVLEGLVNLEVVTKSAGLYHLNLAALGEFGISWATLRGDDPSRALIPLAKKVTAAYDFRD